MKEIWKDIECTCGKYRISNFGRVIRVDCHYTSSGVHRHRPMQYIKTVRLPNGYYMFDVHINKKRKRLYVHREVAKAFISNPNSLPCVNHKDEDKSNNVVTNLEWCDYYYNNSYGTGRQRSVNTRRVNGTLSSKPYTEEELKLVKDLNYSSEEVAKLLGKSKHAIESKRSRCRSEN